MLNELFSPDMMASAIRLTIPILLAALGAIYSERSGVVNIGLEGMMVVGAFWAAWGSFNYGPVVGILFGILAGMLLASIHALVTVTFKVNQIVSGVALNVLAAGISRFSSLSIFGMATTSPHVSGLPKMTIKPLAEISWLKPLVTEFSILIPISFILVGVTVWVLKYTTFGLRLRAAGENPEAADTLGINVFKMRYAGIIISGAFAGLAGAYLSIEHTGMYVEGMTQGKGYIALAAMIFGNWSAIGAMFAALLFGFAEAISLRRITTLVPYQFIKIIPYLLTIIVVSGFVKKSDPPAKVGTNYERGEG